ncbi:hypothetical protein JZ751_019906 [Albula glossodonta]|uniref:TNFR-Cys domain-containing protein n=1 Tax=Albula glossodonta TaxID=121402 RepID=A0A8T2N0I6_9TELE|nr:hypothetical protein JZ751_019906 [Albula glossodonta]
MIRSVSISGIYFKRSNTSRRRHLSVIHYLCSRDHDSMTSLTVTGFGGRARDDSFVIYLSPNTALAMGTLNLHRLDMIASVFFSLFILALSPCTSNELKAPTYKWTDDVTGESLTCEKCPPGTHVVKHCTREQSTVCGKCPERHYTEFWNYVERCRYCNVFCTEDQYEKTPCSPTQNRVCDCKSGFYFEHGLCWKHSACPPGEGVSRNGTAYADVLCAPCAEGYFSSEFSSTKPCQEHSLCAPEERAIPGHEKQDTFCTLCANRTPQNVTSAEDQDACDLAVMDYVTQYPLQQKKRKRLVNTAKRMARQRDENDSLFNLFVSIKKSHTDRPFIEIMVDMLQRARLPHLDWKVRRWFLGEQEEF